MNINSSSLSSKFSRMGGVGTWYSGIYKAFIYASIILFFIYFFTSGSSSYYSLITGFTTFILGISMIIILIMNSILTINSTNTNNNISFNHIGTILYKTGPLFLILGLIGFFLYLCFQYKSPILSGHVSSGYYTFLNISICLMLTQLYLILSSPQTTDKIHINKITAGILYLINLITLVCALTIHSILKYFTTDGFHTN